MITLIFAPIFGFCVIFSRRNRFWILWLPILVLSVFNFILTYLHSQILSNLSDYFLLEVLFSSEVILKNNQYLLWIGIIVSLIQIVIGLKVIGWNSSFQNESRKNSLRHYFIAAGVSGYLLVIIAGMVAMTTLGSINRIAPNFLSFESLRFTYYERVYEKGDKLVFLMPLFPGVRQRKLNRLNLKVKNLVLLESSQDKDWGNIGDSVDFFILNSESPFLNIFRNVMELTTLKNLQLVELAKKRTANIIKTFDEKEAKYEHFYFPWGAVHLPMIERHLKKKGYFLKSFYKIASLKTSEVVTSKKNIKRGILFGYRNAFKIAAPQGWVLDNRSGQKIGLHAVFYRSGESWNKNRASMYSKAVIKGKSFSTVYEYVEFTKNRFAIGGEQGVKVKRLQTIKLDNERVAYIKEWLRKGTVHEAVAYIEEKYAIVLIVMNAESLEEFTNAFPSFMNLVKSYQFLTDDILFDDVSNREMNRIKKEYSKEIKDSEVSSYFEKETSRGLGQFMNIVIKKCALKFPNEKKAEVGIRITQYGFPDRVLNERKSGISKCIRSALSGYYFSPPPRAPIHWYVEINYK